MIVAVSCEAARLVRMVYLSVNVCVCTYRGAVVVEAFERDHFFFPRVYMVH